MKPDVEDPAQPAPAIKRPKYWRRKPDGVIRFYTPAETGAIANWEITQADIRRLADTKLDALLYWSAKGLASWISEKGSGKQYTAPQKVALFQSGFDMFQAGELPETREGDNYLSPEEEAVVAQLPDGLRDQMRQLLLARRKKG